ncbi:hypothetical protein QEN19_002927 [Hanseniaspora menglaensis]
MQVEKTSTIFDDNIKSGIKTERTNETNDLNKQREIYSADAHENDANLEYTYDENENVSLFNLPDLPSIPHREAQVLQLTSFLDLYNLPNAMPTVQFVNGYKSSGVNYVMRKILSHYSNAGYEYIIIKKGSVIDHKSLMRDIGRQLYMLLSNKYPDEDLNDNDGDLRDDDYIKTDEKNLLTYSKIKNIKSGLDARSIETFSSFQDYLKNLLLYYDINILSPTSIYIFLEEFDQYPLLDYNTIFRFYKIIESLHGSKFQLKLIFSFQDSSIMNQYLGGIINPVITQFSRYTTDEVQRILTKHLCKELVAENEGFGKEFIKICCESFIEPLGFDLVQLSKTIKHKYRDAEKEIIQSQYNFAKFLQKNKDILNSVELNLNKKRKRKEITEAEDVEIKQQLPDKYSEFSKLTKYLLISCYYCSYYPSKCDSIFFLKSVNEKRGTKTKASKSNKSAYQVYTEPKGFGIERLLMVFNIFFYQDNSSINPKFLEISQPGTDINCAGSFTQLLDSKYIGKNINDYFDCYRTDCKYKLLLPPIEIKKIAESINFERMEIIA